jgi:hypothetical protein
MKFRSTAGLPMGALLLAMACSSDDTASAEDGGSETTGDTGSQPTTTDTGVVDESGTTALPTTSGSTTDDEVALEFARGIRLLRLTANQGVQVDFVRDGVEVPAEAYASKLIAGRRLLLRGLWTLHADFEPRTVIGRLTLDYPDGTQLVQDDEVMIEGESSDGGASFQWLLEPEQVVPGIRVRVRVLELDPQGVSGEVSDPPPIAPLAGPATLGPLDVPLELKVVLIPVLHQFEACEQAPPITEEDVEALRQALEQANPVQQAILTVGEPMPYLEPIGTSGAGFSPILAALAQRRAEDDPEPNVYYYGLIEPCDGHPPGLLGQAIGIPTEPIPELEHERIATGRWFYAGELATGTFVHEIGHTQGRRHVRCTGGEAGVDPSYPHSNGRIGVWGFGIYDFKLRTPTSSRDYMTYCNNEWVSDYGWAQALATIEVLTSWDFAAHPRTERGPMLAGVLHENGTADWWTMRGVVPAQRLEGGASVRYMLGDVPVELPASVQPIADGSARYVTAPMPADVEHVVSATLHTGTEAIVVPPAAVSLGQEPPQP